MNKTLVCFGDSLTEGAIGVSYVDILRARLPADVRVVNAGITGDTTAGGVRRIDWSLQDGDVKVVILELGANDILRGQPITEMKKNLAAIIERAQQQNIAVLLLGMEAPPNYGPAYTSEFRQVYRDLARDHKVAFVPFYLEGVAGNPALNISDGIHPNPAGARIVEQTIWRALEPLLEKSSR